MTMKQVRLDSPQPVQIAITPTRAFRQTVYDFMQSKGIEADGVVLEFEDAATRDKFVDELRRALGSVSNMAA